jgi:hypothetical protein
MKRSDMITEAKNTRAVATDQETEEGVLPLGAVYHITTIQFAYRGKLVAVTPSYYVLEDSVNVFSTGELTAYRKSRLGSTEEPLGRVLVERGAVTAIWCFD